MDPNKNPIHQKTRGMKYDQRYFKVTPKGQVPKVTKVWNVDETPWYIRYAFDWMLLLIAIPFLVARTLLSVDCWISFILEVVLLGIFFMWLVTLPVGNHERYF